MKKTTKQFKQELENLKGKNVYTVLGEYTGNKNKIKVVHNICGYEWDVAPVNILNKNRECPKCNKKVKNKDTNYFKNEVYELVGEEYTVTGIYTKALEKTTIIHNKCGKEYKVTPHDFLSGNRCPYCYGNKKSNTKEFKERVYSLVGNEYKVIGEYVNIDTKILMKHDKCNKEFEMTPYKFIHRNQRCPYCWKSKGEKTIAEILDKNSVKYLREYTFDDLRGEGGQKLRFDFAILDKESNLKYLIEFDGQFHFNEKYSKHDLYVKHDTLKDTYCKNNYIKLVRINYKDINNIEKILTHVNTEVI